MWDLMERERLAWVTLFKEHPRGKTNSGTGSGKRLDDVR